MKDRFICAKDVSYTYPSFHEGEEKREAIKGLSLDIQKGEFIAIIGRNGSGKSTFSRLLNGLITPTSGTILVNGKNTSDEENIWEIRKNIGMVFQNPDNQIIATIVEEDVAFGPENLGFHPGEVRDRVDQALKSVNMYEYRKHAPHLLSGGQKQRVAIAGILAMKPECIILDEATAMLDPIGRKEVISTVRRLNKEEGITVIHITHHMDEAVHANRVVVIDQGRLVMEGTPREVFSKVDRIRALGLEVPQVTQLIHDLNEQGYNLPASIITVDEAFEYISKLITSMENK